MDRCTSGAKLAVLCVAVALASPGCNASDRVDDGPCAPPEGLFDQATRAMPGPCLTEWDLEDDGILDRYSITDYDEQGLLRTSEFGVIGGNPISLQQWSYDDQGRKLEATTIDLSTGELYARSAYVYDGMMLSRKDDLDLATGQPFRRWSYTYGDTDLVEEIVVEDLPDDDSLHRYLYIHQDGRVAYSNETYWYEGWNMIWERFYDYDQAGFLVQQRYVVWSGSTHDGRTDYVNDELGNPLVESHHDVVDDEWTCTYRHYDCSP